MSLRDELDEIQLKQTRDYQEQVSKSNTNSEAPSLEGSNEKEIKNPFKKDKEFNQEGFSVINILGNKKALLVGGIIILSVVIFAVFMLSKLKPKDEGADFLNELEQVASFQYTVEERDTLRTNGYTADDIERYQAEEMDPYTLVQEAEASRKALLEKEMKSLLDGASPKYKQLESMTWLGTGSMSKEILNNVEGSYEERYGTYNCDYTKVEEHGSQLFIKLELKEFNNKAIFMTMNPSRYNELSKSGNIVVVIEYNKYNDGSILVTNVEEKDIKN